MANVRIFGERRYVMRVGLPADKFASYRLITQDVENAICRSNPELPAGRSESQQRELSVTSPTDLLKPAQFGDTVVKTVNSFWVRVLDVARVKQDAADKRMVAIGLNGRPAIDVRVIS